MTRWYYRLRLFFGIVWRQVEPPGCGIPDKYRTHGRFGVRLAWQVAKDVWRNDA